MECTWAYDSEQQLSKARADSLLQQLVSRHLGPTPFDCKSQPTFESSGRPAGPEEEPCLYQKEGTLETTGCGQIRPYGDSTRRLVCDPGPTFQDMRLMSPASKQNSFRRSSLHLYQRSVPAQICCPARIRPISCHCALQSRVLGPGVVEPHGHPCPVLLWFVLDQPQSQLE